MTKWGSVTTNAGTEEERELTETQSRSDVTYLGIFKCRSRSELAFVSATGEIVYGILPRTSSIHFSLLQLQIAGKMVHKPSVRQTDRPG